MKFHRMLLVVVAILVSIAGIFSAVAQPSNEIATAPLYVPDTTHQNDPLPDGVIAWDATLKAVDAVEGGDFARFTFSFTNIATVTDITLITNVTETPRTSSASPTPSRRFPSRS
jgi:hypothetical protein